MRVAGNLVFALNHGSSTESHLEVVIFNLRVVCRGLVPKPLIKENSIMRRNVGYVLMTMTILLCLAATAFGQRTTGGVEGRIVDVNAAVVPGITVTLTGVSVGFSRTVESDSQGEFRILEVPIGTYKVATAAKSGFSAAVVDDVIVTIEKATQVNIRVGVSSTAEAVSITADELGVSVSDSKVQTNITQKMIDLLPSGASFTSLLKSLAGNEARTAFRWLSSGRRFRFRKLVYHRWTPG